MKKLIAALLSVILLVPAGCSAIRPVENKPSAAASTSKATAPPLPTVLPSATVSPSFKPSITALPSVKPSSSVPPLITALPSIAPVSPSASTPGVVSPADYFPVKADTRMAYQGIGNEFAEFVQYTDYIGNGAFQLRTNNGGTETVTVYTADSGAVTEVFKQHETYFRYDYTAERATNEPLIKAPIAVGTAWTLANGSTRSITAVSVDVTVPYGTFKALEVTTKNTDSTIKDYYSAGVGLVKRVFTTKDDPSYEVISALEKVEAGSALTQNIRFYYPDHSNNSYGIVFVDRAVAFRTGESVLSKLEDGFKNVPAGSGFSRVMTKGAAINKITCDFATSIVTVDFSKSFITEMNAGSGFEGQILESIGDTLGNYFLTNKVAITIDGGPYESGHFLFRSGDFLPVRPEKAAAYSA